MNASLQTIIAAKMSLRTSPHSIIEWKKFIALLILLSRELEQPVSLSSLLFRYRAF